MGVSQLVTYEVTETERRLSADLELDIREAPIREWIVEFPEDYSLVTATGSSLADFLVAAEAANGRKKLTLLFGGEVTGRQLVSLVFEKNEAAVAGSWVLPGSSFPMRSRCVVTSAWPVPTDSASPPRPRTCS